MDFSKLNLNGNEYNVKDTIARPFENISEMKSNSDLVDGNIVKTIGYYEANDGGGATYKITNATDLIEDGAFVHKLNNELYAELIIDDYVIPEQVGAKANGITDDSSIFELIINKGYNIILSEKIYGISKITLQNNIKIIGSGIEKSILKYVGNDENDSMISIVDYDYNYNDIKELSIDGSNICSIGINIKPDESIEATGWVNDAFITLEKLKIYNCVNSGIYNKYGREVRLNNIDVSYCGYGINVISSDCYYEMVSCWRNKKAGFRIGGTSSRFIDCKSFANGYQNTSGDRKELCGYYITGYSNNLSCCEAQENYGDGFLIHNGQNSFINCKADANGQLIITGNDDDLIYDGFHIADDTELSFGINNILLIGTFDDFRRSNNKQVQRYGIYFGTLSNSYIILNGVNNVKDYHYKSTWSVNLNYNSNNYFMLNGKLIGGMVGSFITLDKLGNEYPQLQIKSNDYNYLLKTDVNRLNLMVTDNNHAYKGTAFSYERGESGGKISFFGVTPIERQTAGTNATDLDSVIALANQLNTILKTYGLLK